MEDEDDEIDDDGEPAYCPYCADETEDCDHLFARFDLSDGYCEAGFCDMDKFIDEVRRVFHLALVDGRTELEPISGEDLQQLWDDARSQYKLGDPQEKIEIDGYALIRILMDVLSSNGIDQQDGTDQGGPGQSTVTAAFYSKNPEKTFAKVLEDFQIRLFIATTPESVWDVKTKKKPAKRKAAKKPAKKKAPTKKPTKKTRSKKKASSRPRR